MVLSIVLVNYNTGEYLDKCLNSIESKISNLEYEVIVVDNNSTENYIKFLPVKYSRFHFHFLTTNKGFGAGCNYGVSKSRGKYILFLNPDVEILDSSLKKLIDFMDENENTGACSGLTVDEENKISYCYNFFPDLKWNFKQATGIGLMKTIYQLTNARSIRENRIFEVDWFHGAFLIVKKTVFKSINGFDEKIFLYYEDTDLQKRIKELGYKIFCLPMVKVSHFTQGSVRSEQGRKLYYFHINMGNLYYINKHFNTIEKLLTRFFYIIGTSIKILIAPFREKYRKDLVHYFKNHFVVLKVYLTKFNVTKT